jgi:hypothetical protein
LLLLDMYAYSKGSHCSWPTATLLDAHSQLLLHMLPHPKGSLSYEPTAAAQGGHHQLLQSK